MRRNPPFEDCDRLPKGGLREYANPPYDAPDWEPKSWKPVPSEVEELQFPEAARREAGAWKRVENINGRTYAFCSLSLRREDEYAVA
jgi:hypothetical protein